MPRTPVTIRMDAALLAQVRARANGENRTLTNYIETVLKHAVGPAHEARAGVPADAPPFIPPGPFILAMAGRDAEASDEAGET